MSAAGGKDERMSEGQVWADDFTGAMYATQDATEELRCAICGQPIRGRPFGIELPGGRVTHDDCYLGSDPGSSVLWTPPENAPDPMDLVTAMTAPLDEGVAAALEQARELNERQPFHVTGEDREMAAAWAAWAGPEHLGTDLQRITDIARGFVAGYRAGKTAGRDRD